MHCEKIENLKHALYLHALGQKKTCESFGIKPRQTQYVRLKVVSIYINQENNN
jgi:hypothetical protein